MNLTYKRATIDDLDILTSTRIEVPISQTALEALNRGDLFH